MEYCTETIEFKLEMPGKTLPVGEVISYLESIRVLMESINDTLNQKTGLGYDKIEVQLIACKEGSFRIPVEVRKFFRHPMVTTIGGVFIGWALPVLFPGNGTGKAELSQEFPIGKRNLLENPSTKVSVANIAQLVVANDSIQSLSLKYSTSTGEQQGVNVTKETLRQIATQEDEEVVEEDEERTLYRQTLELISPVLKPEEAKWKMKLDGKTRDILMSDPNFIDHMDEGVFAVGDIFIVDLVIRMEPGKRDSYRIIRVHEHRHKPRHTQRTLFED